MSCWLATAGRAEFLFGLGAGLAMEGLGRGRPGHRSVDSDRHPPGRGPAVDERKIALLK